MTHPRQPWEQAIAGAWLQWQLLRHRHPSLWPRGLRLLLLALTMGITVLAGAQLVWRSEWRLLEEARAAESLLKKAFEDKVRQARHLPVLRRQKSTVASQLAQLEQQLPDKSEMEALLSEINQAGVARGLQFELFKPGTVTLAHHYAELPIEIRLTGDFHALAGFVSDIANLPRIVTLDQLSLQQLREGVQSFSCIARTYRYLDHEEQRQQTRASAASRPVRQ